MAAQHAAIVTTRAAGRTYGLQESAVPVSRIGQCREKLSNDGVPKIRPHQCFAIISVTTMNFDMIFYSSIYENEMFRVSFSLVYLLYARLQTLTKVLNSHCHSATDLRKVVPDLMQFVSKLPSHRWLFSSLW